MPSRLNQWLSSLPVLALYAATVLLETPVIFARWLLALAFAALVLLVLHHSVAGADSLAQLALIPTAWSLIALITPLGAGGGGGRTSGDANHPSVSALLITTRSSCCATAH